MLDGALAALIGVRTAGSAISGAAIAHRFRRAGKLRPLPANRDKHAGERPRHRRPPALSSGERRSRWWTQEAAPRWARNCLPRSADSSTDQSDVSSTRWTTRITSSGTPRSYQNGVHLRRTSQSAEPNRRAYYRPTLIPCDSDERAITAPLRQTTRRSPDQSAQRIRRTAIKIVRAARTTAVTRRNQ